MTTESHRATNESQIRALIDDRTKAVRAKDIARATSGIAPDILTFDVVNPLQHIGSDASRKRAEEWFSSFQGSIGYCELSRAPSENRRILYRQNEVQETQCSFFPIYRRLPKLDVAGSTPVSRSIFSITYRL